MNRRSARWWGLCLLHNWIIHPLLPLADLLDELGERRLSALLYRLHDESAPDGGG